MLLWGKEKGEERRKLGFLEVNVWGVEQIGVVEGEHDGTGREEGWELWKVNMKVWEEYRWQVGGCGKDKGRKAGEWKVG